MQRYPEKSNKQNNRSIALINPNIYRLPNAAFMETRHLRKMFNSLEWKRRTCIVQF